MTQPAWTDDPSRVRPMLASPAADADTADLVSARVIFEPKYDGMRLLVSVEPSEPAARVTLWSRNGNDKTAQFPDVVKALRQFARDLRAPVLLDGELVALDPRGQPTTFRRLAGRLHLVGDRSIEEQARRQPVAFVAFDLLRDGRDDLRRLPLVDRKARLERVFGTAASEMVRMSEMAAGDGRRLLERAHRDGWEGLVAKDAASIYETGRRSKAWRKLKLPHRHEFVVGGWTDPRETRQHFGSLAIGYFEGTGRKRVLRFAGLVGSGFTASELARFAGLLAARATPTCPFAAHAELPRKGHWVEPELVVEVKFTEWTDEGLLRHPVYLGQRDDKRAADVGREGERKSWAGRAGSGGRNSGGAGLQPCDPHLDLVTAQLAALEESRRDGSVLLPDGSTLEVTNLWKVFWPGSGLTKGELLRHYVRVAPYIMPCVSDRALVMKRYPNGVAGKAFYQQRAPEEVQPGVRVEVVPDDDEEVPRLVGGSLITLLYMAQLAAISQDPWFSRINSPAEPDYVALDLDPMPGVPFSQVVDVARAVGETLDALGVTAVPKTSGSSGLHVYVPLAPGTTYEAGQLFCQIVATLVATKHPTLATVERVVGKRGRTVYVDYLQNIQGKTLATAYSARSSEFAGVSTPLAWNELGPDLHPEDFTIGTFGARLAQAGDLWAAVHGRRRTDLRGVLEKLAGRGSK